MGVTVAVMRQSSPVEMADAMHKLLGGMPDFFCDEAVVLDFAELGHKPPSIDWAGLLSLLKRYRLQPVGVRHLPAELLETARKAGLAILDNAPLHERPAELPAKAQAAPVPPPPIQEAQSKEAALPIQAGTMFIDRPVRTGQQIYSRGGDLVLLAGMSPGAEIIADGSVHCYGPLRGRVLAGAQGDTAARVIASNFGPELVSIAGIYRTFERGLPESVGGRPAVVKLKEKTLTIEPLRLD